LPRLDDAKWPRALQKSVNRAQRAGGRECEKTPAYPPRSFKVLVLQPGQAGGNELGPNKTSYNDDIIEGWVGVGSQIDGLGHIGVNWVYYNGLKSGDFAAADGLKKLGVEKIPPIVTRGVRPGERRSKHFACTARRMLCERHARPHSTLDRRQRALA
jgi:hypothetical protein